MLWLSLGETKEKDIELIYQLELSPENAAFIIPYSKEKHQGGIKDPSLKYLSIFYESKFSGFIILALEQLGETIEFKRIVVGNKQKGIGQQAISLMENYCIKNMGTKRIWLDVFEDNSRGIHIYSKLNYQTFGVSAYNERKLIFMEKTISS